MDKNVKALHHSGGICMCACMPTMRISSPPPSHPNAPQASDPSAEELKTATQKKGNVVMPVSVSKSAPELVKITKDMKVRVCGWDGAVGWVVELGGLVQLAVVCGVAASQGVGANMHQWSRCCLFCIG